MDKTLRLHNKDGSKSGWLIECPGCNMGHLFDSRWGFNGNTEEPTFTPSMLSKTPDGGICHSFVTKGNIKFLNDCTHKLKGQTVALLIMD